MAHRQLIVCPYSSVHTDETHLWRHEQQENLYKFIKQTARGFSYRQEYDIKSHQIHRSFEAYCINENPVQSIERRDAFREDLDRWDDYFWIDLRPILGDLDEMRQGKADAVEALVQLFPAWRDLETSFSEDVKLEAMGYGKSLLQEYLRMVCDLKSGNLVDYLQAPMNSTYVEGLLHYNADKMDIEARIERVSRFLASEYFVAIPYVQISCGLFAVLRKMVKNGAYTNEENARKKLSGIFYDSRCISAFGPYSDVIFVDRVMDQWANDPEAKLFDAYATRVFSVSDWDGFHEYLDEVENNFTEEVQEALSWVYPET